jgi:pyruvate formate-lyase activating enzyme-like uncharacterized protein
MDATRKKQEIDAVRQQVGWVYSDLPWFSEAEARQAHRQRHELLEALSGWISYSFLGSKPHFGPLSPGCLICGNGGWGCNFINTLCTRNCFYCPQKRSRKEERDSQTDGIIFKNPQEHINFIKTFQIRGVGFSGGEPLLVLDRLLAHIKAIREEFGNSLYLWVYTNGDLINRRTLKQLGTAGVDEIRFDLSARKYDLAPVAMTKGHIPTVTVEIPAIPEDLELVQSLLGRMEQVGVNFLNLHQLYATRYNYQKLIRRPYHFLHQHNIPVFESEISALKLLLFVREHQVQLPINYCCSSYKNRFQFREGRTRQARTVLRGFEEITDAGYIRSFKVADATEKMESMIRRLKKANCPPAQWQCHERKTEVTIHGDLLPYVDWSSADVAISYFEPGVGLKDPERGLTEGNLLPMNSVVCQEHGFSELAIKCWHKLYRQGMESNAVYEEFFHHYPMRGPDDIAELKKELGRLKNLAQWEVLESGLPEVF